MRSVDCVFKAVYSWTQSLILRHAGMQHIYSPFHKERAVGDIHLKIKLLRAVLSDQPGLKSIVIIIRWLVVPPPQVSFQ